MANLKIENINGGLNFLVKVVPGSSKTCVCGLLDEMLKVKISAAPEKGKANKCLVDFLAKKLGVKKKDINIVSGQTSPVKGIEVSGITEENLFSKLGLDR